MEAAIRALLEVADHCKITLRFNLLSKIRRGVRHARHREEFGSDLR